MRALRPAVLFALLALLGLAPPAAADGDPEQPLVRVPDYGLDELVPAEGTQPPGWAPVTEPGVVPAQAPSVRGLLAIAKAAAVDMAKVDVRCHPLQQGEGAARQVVVLALLAVDEHADAFTKALADAVLEHGWGVRQLGSSMRVLLTWGSRREAAEEVRAWWVGRVVHQTTQQAVDRILRAGRTGDRVLWKQGLALLERAARIEPRAAFVLAVRARMVPRNQPELALGFYRGALRPDAPVPPPDPWKSTAAARLGQLLLERAQPAELAEALAALQLAVKLAAHIEDPLDRFGAHYNLACAFARAGRIDEAFARLDTSLAEGRRLLGARFAFHFDHARSKDPDMAPLRKDERFAALMAKHDPAPAQPAPKDG